MEVSTLMIIMLAVRSCMGSISEGLPKLVNQFARLLVHLLS